MSAVESRLENVAGSFDEDVDISLSTESVDGLGEKQWCESLSAKVVDQNILHGLREILALRLQNKTMTTSTVPIWIRIAKASRVYQAIRWYKNSFADKISDPFLKGDRHDLMKKTDQGLGFVVSLPRF